MAEQNWKNLRVAETEKYAHVTYFFNGGNEKPYPGEERELVPSPKVATYDLKPEMSAEGVTETVINAIERRDFDVIVMNFANADMVGHSGKFAPTVRAVETVDAGLGAIYDALRRAGGRWIITADHGNAETMIDPVTKGPHTYHTTNPVPFIVVDEEKRPLRSGGSLQDIAPTDSGDAGRRAAERDDRPGFAKIIVMATTSALMTVEQYSALPEPEGGRYELRHGVPVKVSFPKPEHWEIQQRLTELLKPRAAGRGRVGPEVAFRPLPEYEVWSADVAFVSQPRYDRRPAGDYLHPAPELVIEVLSPSNTVSEISDREAMGLENGCLEFWVVDPKRKTVKVSTPDRRTITYIEGDQIPLTVPAAGVLAVSEIFSNA